MKVYLIGVGMGNLDTLTFGARCAIEKSQLLIGSKRLLEPFADTDAKKLTHTRSNDIVEAINSSDAQIASVLFSGDIGFFSGASLLYDRLADHELVCIPGISSLVYFCAKLHTTWQDVHLISTHGRKMNAVGAIQTHLKTFAITGGATKVQDICLQLVAAGLPSVRVVAGERLSYPDERIVKGSAAELSGQQFADLSVMLVENPDYITRPFEAPALSDENFVRADVPMTKEETRELIMCKLHIERSSIVWDVGAGTGSISVEAALAAREGRVFAIERDDDACEVIDRNKRQFKLSNLKLVHGQAPGVLCDLPSPDRVFIGGSGGQIGAVFKLAVQKNPHVRIVAAAITLETLARLLECVTKSDFLRTEIVQINVSRAKRAGSYHMMMAENPIYVVSAEKAGK